MLSFYRTKIAAASDRTVAAVAIGAVIAQLATYWLALCGNSPVSIVAMLIGFSAGAVFANWGNEFLPRRHESSGIANVPAITLGAAIIALCWIAPGLLNSTLLAGCETIGTGGSLKTMLTLLFPAIVVATISGLCGLYFRASTTHHERTSKRSFLFCGFGVFCVLLNSWVAWPLALLPSAAILLSLVLSARLIPNDANITDPEALRESTATTALLPLHFVAVGILAVSVFEIGSRLFPIDIPVLMLMIGTTSAVLLLLSSQNAVRLLKQTGMITVALMLVAALPLMFSYLADFNLWAGTQGNSAVFVIVMRALQCSIVAVAASLPAVLTSVSSGSRSSTQTTLLSVTTGVVLAMAAIGRGFSPVLVQATGILACALAVLLPMFNAKTGFILSASFRSRQYSFRPAALLLLIPLLTAFETYDATRTASLMFSPRTVAAIQRGVERELIPQSDATRLIATAHGIAGELSVWRRAGNVVEFQRNGIALGRVSTDTNLSPQPAEEILPAIMALVSHPKPGRVLVLGDDTGACLRSCSHFPVQEIVAVRSESQLTQLAHRFTWSSQKIPADSDPRVRILHAPPIIAMKNRDLDFFDVVITSSDAAQSLSGMPQFTREFYETARSRMNSESVFCQRFRQAGLGPDPIKEAMATLMDVFAHVGAVQTVPGEILLFATDSERGLVNPEILSRLQRDHVQQEIASAGWDWSQVAVLPLVDAHDPIGIFTHEKLPRALSINNGGFALRLPFEFLRQGAKNEELRLAFAPHQTQLLASVPVDQSHEEVQRRLTALAQQLEILAGMPDQPWTYRTSLRMEMQRSPRPPQEVIQNGHVVKTAHPLDVFNREYFQSLGRALTAASQAQPISADIEAMERFTENPEPLLSHFAHYEIIRLHEMANHPSPADEFRHRLHIVFYTSPSDASVRPVISAIEQLVKAPQLIADNSDRYDMLNSLLQKLIERWEARTVWEPRSAVRVQNDVDQSVRIANRALDLMEKDLVSVDLERMEFLRRRRYINAALIAPLRDYRDRVLAHRMKTEAPADSVSEDPNDMPLLLNSGEDLNTN